MLPTRGADHCQPKNENHYVQGHDRQVKEILLERKVVKTPKFENLKDVLSLRLEPKISNKLKELAHREGLPPTTFARMLIIKVSERNWAPIREKGGNPETSSKTA